MKALAPLTLLLLWPTCASAQLELHGFVETAAGVRLHEVPGAPDYWDPTMLPPLWNSEEEFTLLEARLQLRGDLYGDAGDAHFAIDVLGDQVVEDQDQLLIREAWARFTVLGDHVDFRAGRQPVTWGTGNLLFINDLFPKDWVSFFSGRDDEYLKLPVTAARTAIFGLPVDVDLVYVPRFTPDAVPVGERLVYWAPSEQPAELPEDRLANGELSLRLNHYFGTWNWALYGYAGRWKQPLGAQASAGAIDGFYYPELSVFGASTRGTLAGGVAWVEGGYYDSREDRDGRDPLVPNSELRAMAGYEREWLKQTTIGLQVYTEYMEDYDGAVTARADLIDAGVLAGGDRTQLEDQFYLKDEFRTLLTLNLRKAWLYQTLTASAFLYYSPSDQDSYTRLAVGYALSDAVTLTLGANLFTAEDPRTTFGMNDANDNLYARVRYGF